MTTMKIALIEQKTALIAYLASKIKAGDWHAVQDAASDIREIEAKISVLDAMVEMPAPPLPEWQAELQADPALARRIG